MNKELREIRYETPTEELKNLQQPSIFLAGPTVRGNQQHLVSWRFECVEILKKLGFKGNVIIPEFQDTKASDKGVLWIPRWEFEGLKKADCIIFYIPRSRELIGLNTNYEFGYWSVKSPDKIAYGRPDDAYRIAYNDLMWNAIKEDAGLPAPQIHNTLQKTVESAILLIKTPKKTIEYPFAKKILEDRLRLEEESLAYWNKVLKSDRSTIAGIRQANGNIPSTEHRIGELVNALKLL